MLISVYVKYFIRANRLVNLSSSNQLSNIMSTTDPVNESENYNIDIGDMRIKYKDKSESFIQNNLISKEPIGQFRTWFEKACNTPQILEPNAVALATTTRDGIPSLRMVLLKSFGTEGFKFFTNYDSRKGREIAENPHVALTFYWPYLNQSVRIEGIAEKTSVEDSENYFQRRPYKSQLGAAASKQSTVIAGRETLIKKAKELTTQYPEGFVKRPDCWGGYLVVPHCIEFWQGQTDRLHDRIRFRRPKTGEKIDNTFLHAGENGWVYEILSP